MPRSYAALLPTAHAVLRLLVVLNWLFGAGILALLIAAIVAGPWTIAALGVPPASGMGPVTNGVRAIAALGLVAIPLNDVVLRRLLSIIETVRSGDAFVAANADRLKAIAWALLALQILSLVIGWVAEAISTPAHPFHLDAGFSISGWLAVLMSFVLAGIFAEGTRMRDDLAGTV